MAARPSLTIRQNFNVAAPIVVGTNLPAVVIGISRDIYYKGASIDSDGITTFEAGNVWLPRPEDASWVQTYIAELTTFPASEYDDQVDVTSQAVLYMTASRFIWL